MISGSGSLTVLTASPGVGRGVSGDVESVSTTQVSTARRLHFDVLAVSVGGHVEPLVILMQAEKVEFNEVAEGECIPLARAGGKCWMCGRGIVLKMSSAPHYPALYSTTSGLLPLSDIGMSRNLCLRGTSLHQGIHLRHARPGECDCLSFVIAPPSTSQWPRDQSNLCPQIS